MQINPVHSAEVRLSANCNDPQTRSTVTLHYDTTAIVLHWLIAALIAMVFVLGLTVDSFPKSMTGAIINLHALLGVAILVLTLVRLGWRLTHRPPEPGAANGPLIRITSKAAHVLLYVLMILVPLIGFPTLFYRGRGLDFGILQIAPFLPRTPEIYRPLTEFHEYAAFALVGLAAGHVLAALYHQFVLKDGLMARMAPTPRSYGSGEAPSQPIPGARENQIRIG